MKLIHLSPDILHNVLTIPRIIDEFHREYKLLSQFRYILHNIKNINDYIYIYKNIAKICFGSINIKNDCKFNDSTNFMIIAENKQKIIDKFINIQSNQYIFNFTYYIKIRYNDLFNYHYINVKNVESNCIEDMNGDIINNGYYFDEIFDCYPVNNFLKRFDGKYLNLVIKHELSLNPRFYVRIVDKYNFEFLSEIYI